MTYTIPSLDADTTYTVQVSATRTNASDGAASNTKTGRPKEQPPAQVTGVTTAKTNTVGELKVDWDAAANADGYVVQWKSGDQEYNTGDRQATVTDSSTRTYTITGLTGGTEHTVQVTATRTNADNGEASSGTTGTPREAKPVKVTGVSADKTATVGELKVDWTAVTNADGYKVQWKSGMQAFSATDRIQTITGGSTETYTITGLTGATAYTVRVIATRDHSFDGDPSNETSGTPLAEAPAQVTDVTWRRRRWSR